MLFNFENQKINVMILDQKLKLYKFDLVVTVIFITEFDTMSQINNFYVIFERFSVRNGF